MSEKIEAPVAKMYVASDSAICGGCRRCELVCSLFHYGECNLELSSVHVIKDAFSGEYEIETCRQCKGAECLSICPVEGAIYIDENTGARVINEEKCSGCRLCEEECLFHMIGYIPEKNLCFKCDLCGGEPQCVENCPHTALTIVKA